MTSKEGKSKRAKAGTIRNDSVADSKDTEKLLEEGRARLLLPSTTQYPLVIEVEAGLLPRHCCWVLSCLHGRPISACRWATCTGLCRVSQNVAGPGRWAYWTGFLQGFTENGWPWQMGYLHRVLHDCTECGWPWQMGYLHRVLYDCTTCGWPLADTIHGAEQGISPNGAGNRGAGRSRQHEAPGK